MLDQLTAAKASSWRRRSRYQPVTTWKAVDCLPALDGTRRRFVCCSSIPRIDQDVREQASPVGFGDPSRPGPVASPARAGNTSRLVDLKREGRMNGSSLTVAEALLLRLRNAGVPYLFANAGTDAAPLIEASAHFDAERIGPVPQPVTVAHEMAAVSMAHGHAMATGLPSAVFLHVSVGTANAASGIMNASRQRIPMLVMAGRTPVLADGSPGSRDMYIHWAQESFDQASMVREYTRWDYELRYPTPGKRRGRPGTRSGHRRSGRPGLSVPSAGAAHRTCGARIAGRSYCRPHTTSVGSTVVTRPSTTGSGSGQRATSQKDRAGPGGYRRCSCGRVLCVRHGGGGSY